MCRHLAWVADAELPLSAPLYDAPHALCEQARHPKHQKSGDCNPDGWGVAWYVAGADTPAHYRTVTPIWDDHAFPARARTLRSRAAIAAARLASPGATLVETGNAPFVSGPWAFSLNGYVREFHDGAGDELRAHMTPERRNALSGDADSEVLFGLALDRIDAGLGPSEALADVVHLVTSITKGRLNMLLTDGRTVHATRYGNSLFRLGASTIASEPLDERAGWTEVRDESVWTGAPHGGVGTSL
jgi:glutamine amidotransferase